MGGIFKTFFSCQKLTKIGSAKKSTSQNPRSSLVQICQTNKRKICTTLGLWNGIANSRYLGIPLHILKAKTSSFQSVLDRINDKLATWKSKTLTKAVRGVPIKLVASSIPSYTMSMLLLPTTICTKIGSSPAKFFWGHNKMGKPRINLRAWDAICSQRYKGD